MRLAAVAVAGMLTLCPASAAAAGSAVIESSRDAVLIEDPDGSRANGSGPFTFAGRTSQMQNGLRRALLWFDVARALPPGAIVERVELVLTVETSNPADAELRVHRVLADWGEGPSSASGGSGAPAEPGDVTWIHTYHDAEFWIHAGGQFVGRPSAAATVGASGVYTWHDDPRLLADVRLWLANPRANHGWLVIGDESTRQTSKAIASREHPDAALRPRLVIDFRLPPGGPRPHPLYSEAAPRPSAPAAR